MAQHRTGILSSGWFWTRFASVLSRLVQFAVEAAAARAGVVVVVAGRGDCGGGAAAVVVVKYSHRTSM